MMKLFFAIFFVLFVFLEWTSFSEARDDWEYWSEFELEADVGEKWEFYFQEETKFQDDFGNFYLTSPTVALLWKPEKFLEIGPGYKYEYEEKSNGKNIDENWVFLQATYKTAFEKWKLSSRHRFGHQVTSDDEFWRWRGHLKLSHPVLLGEFLITPFISDELFWDDRKDEFNQNRLKLGIFRQLTEKIGLDLFYLLQSKRSGSDWNEAEVLGTEFKLSF